MSLNTAKINTVLAQQRVVADPLARHKIGAFLRIGVPTSVNHRGVGEGASGRLNPGR